MWIKICGNTNLEDAQAAVEAGADALGFIFAPSKRRISPREAAAIVGKLPAKVEKIGVFVNQSPEIVLDTVEKARLTGVQLHGDEDAVFGRELLQRVARRPFRFIKALRMTSPDQAITRGAELQDGGFDAVLLDSASGADRGGSGETFVWNEAEPVVRFLGRKFKVIVAGGLTAANVAKAVELFQPWGVDVVSGVESEPGKKDHEKLRAFVSAAKRQDNTETRTHGED